MFHVRFDFVHVFLTELLHGIAERYGVGLQESKQMLRFFYTERKRMQKRFFFFHINVNI